MSDLISNITHCPFCGLKFSYVKGCSNYYHTYDFKMDLQY